MDEDGDNADEVKQAKKLRKDHRKAYRFIRSNLSEAAFDSTVDKSLNVPQLLRHLRSFFYNDGTYHDREVLRGEWEELKLSDYEDYLEYQLAFDSILRQMRIYQITAASGEEDVLHKFYKGLGPGWKGEVKMAQAMKYDLVEAQAHMRERCPEHVCNIPRRKI